jgi:hypothetical protein
MSNTQQEKPPMHTAENFYRTKAPFNIQGLGIAAHANQVISDRQRSNSHNFTGTGISKFRGGISGQSAGGYNR